MAAASIRSSSGLTDVTGYCVMAEVRVGGNGAPGGPEELKIGRSPKSASSGRVTWTTDLSGGFDSGIVNVRLDLPPGGGAQGVGWSVDGASPRPILYRSVLYGAIRQVLVRAAVQTGALMLWREMQIAFYKDYVPTDGLVLRTGPHVDTTADGEQIAEQILTVTPAASDNDKIVVTSQIEMSAPAAVIPGANDIFGQIFVFADSCNPL